MNKGVGGSLGSLGCSVSDMLLRLGSLRSGDGFSWRLNNPKSPKGPCGWAVPPQAMCTVPTPLCLAPRTLWPGPGPGVGHGHRQMRIWPPPFTVAGLKRAPLGWEWRHQLCALLHW